MLVKFQKHFGINFKFELSLKILFCHAQNILGITKSSDQEGRQLKASCKQWNLRF